VFKNLTRYKFENNFIWELCKMLKLIARVLKFFALSSMVLYNLLIVLYNHFGLTTLFLDLYLIKFLDTSKLFFPCVSPYVFNT